ncbi:MAG TPA: hypothetical protein VNP98_09750 [Chthoniobacterales bacterium]|nr:hypothetical protein [Chthoniobacterales bacterium]
MVASLAFSVNHSNISQIAQPSSHFIMVAEKNNHQCIVRFLKDKPLRQAGATFENASDQFANPKPAMNMRVAKSRA